MLAAYPMREEEGERKWKSEREEERGRVGKRETREKRERET